MVSMHDGDVISILDARLHNSRRISATCRCVVWTKTCGPGRSLSLLLTMAAFTEIDRLPTVNLPPVEDLLV